MRLFHFTVSAIGYISTNYAGYQSSSTGSIAFCSVVGARVLQLLAKVADWDIGVGRPSSILKR